MTVFELLPDVDTTAKRRARRDSKHEDKDSATARMMLLHSMGRTAWIEPTDKVHEGFVLEVEDSDA